MVKHKKRSSCKVISDSIRRPNCALDRRTILYLYVPAGFQRQIFKHVYFFCRSDGKTKDQKKNKGSVLVVESSDNCQNAQIGLVKKFLKDFMI